MNSSEGRQVKRYDCYGKDDFGDHYAALHDEDPDGDYYLASDVAARDAQCLELLKTLGHEEGCGVYVCSSNASYKNKCHQCGANEDAFRHDKFTAGGHPFVPSSCNCAHAKLAALLGRIKG